MKISTGSIIPHLALMRVFTVSYWASPLVSTGQRKRKQNGEESMLLEMTSFAEIFQITDCQKVPDPLRNAKQKRFVAWRVTPSFELNAESKETKVRKKRWYVAHVLYSINLFWPKKTFRGPERGPDWGSEGRSRFCLRPICILAFLHSSSSYRSWCSGTSRCNKNFRSVCCWCFS